MRDRIRLLSPCLHVLSEHRSTSLCPRDIRALSNDTQGREHAVETYVRRLERIKTPLLKSQTHPRALSRDAYNPHGTRFEPRLRNLSPHTVNVIMNTVKRDLCWVYIPYIHTVLTRRIFETNAYLVAPNWHLARAQFPLAYSLSTSRQVASVRFTIWMYHKDAVDRW